MERKKLEKTEPLLATEEILQIAREDLGEEKWIRRTYTPDVKVWVYKYNLFFRAKTLEKGVLLVAMYLRADLAGGCKKPHFHIFLDREKRQFATYDLPGRKWSDAKIDMLQYPHESGECFGTAAYEDKAASVIVNNYFGTGKKAVKAAVLEFQYDIREENLNRKYRSEMEEIDAAMNLVPELPEDFEDWAKEYGLYTNRYIIYHADAKKRMQKAYCLQCQQDIMVTDARRNKEVKCPSCGKKAILKPWSSQAIREEAGIAILQRLKDDSGWVARKFKITLSASGHKERNWEPRYHLSERKRKIFTDELITQRYYEFGEYKNTGVQRWCHHCKSSGYYYAGYYEELGDARIYWKNLARERKGTKLQYIPLEKALRSSPGAYVDVERMLFSIRTTPEIEYFIKMGFRRLAMDMLNRKVELQKGKKPWEKLGLKKQDMELVKKWNLNFRQIEILGKLEQWGSRANKEEVLFFAKYCNERMLDNMLCHATAHKFYRYFTEVLKNTREYGDYMDYLAAAVINKYDMKNEMVLFPKHFKQAHDAAIEERLEREKKAKNREIQRKNKKYAKMIPEIKAMYEFEDEQFFIKVPEKKSDFTQEGHMNNNCVATYFDKVVAGECVVVFLRKKELPDQAFCTVEIRNVATIQQLRSRYNNEAPPEAEDFAKKWIKEVNRRQKKKMLEKQVEEPLRIVV